MSDLTLNDKLIDSIINGDFNQVSQLITDGADVRYLDNEPIKIAAQKGNISIVSLLHSKGADLDVAMQSCDYSIKDELDSYEFAIYERKLLEDDFKNYPPTAPTRKLIDF